MSESKFVFKEPSGVSYDLSLKTGRKTHQSDAAAGCDAALSSVSQQQQKPESCG